MPVTFSHVDAAIAAQLRAVVEAWNADAHRAGVRVAALFAESDDRELPALKHGGYPAAAIVSVVPLVQRMFVGHDALVRIDYWAWSELSDAGREALLAHEVMHLEVLKLDFDDDRWSPAAWWQTDDLGRPKLKLKPADWNGGDGWASVVARYGDACLEARNLARVRAIVEPALKGEVPA